ncbi:MAG: hypothetical protein NTZ67_01485 [Gammaproteobacteria bacterium]|nr:hypothetical protein [Gammaproteobacteria bacterium]
MRSNSAENDLLIPGTDELERVNVVREKERLPYVDFMFLKILRHYMRASLRENVLTAILNCDIKGLDLYQRLSNYNQLGECRCCIPLSRPENPELDFRRKWAALVLGTIHQQYADKKNISHLVVIGSGFLLNEVFLLALLMKNPTEEDITLDLIDILYNNQSDHSFKINYEALIKQFLFLLHYGLGFGIEFGIEYQSNLEAKSDPCREMNQCILSITKEMSEQSYHLPTRKIIISFFGDTLGYDKKRLGMHGDVTICDIDLEMSGTKSCPNRHFSIVYPVITAAPENAFWCSATKYYYRDGIELFKKTMGANKRWVNSPEMPVRGGEEIYCTDEQLNNKTPYVVL